MIGEVSPSDVGPFASDQSGFPRFIGGRSRRRVAGLGGFRLQTSHWPHNSNNSNRPQLSNERKHSRARQEARNQVTMANAMRNALMRMGLPQPAAEYARTTMGLDTLDAWRDFHTDDDLDGLAKNLRSPGGTLGQGANVHRHPGFPVSVKAISNLKVMRLALKHHQHIQRAVEPADVDEDWIETWEFLVDFRKDASKKKPDDDELPKVNMSDWPKTKEKIIDHFTEVYGQEGIPLAYILRQEADVKPEAEDPQEDYEDDHVKELITRAPHEGPTYRADNRTMCRLLKKMTADTPAYEYISKYTADGRQAWLDLLDTYLGSQHTQIQATIWEAKLRECTYEGETSRWNFEKAVNVHKTGHTRLDGLKPYGYLGMDEGTKIRHLLNSIKDPKLKTVVELVRGNEQYNTFDSVVRRIKDSIAVEKPAKKTRFVSSVVIKNKRGEEVHPGVEPDMSVEDKYYPPAEWNRLSPAKQKGVLYKRQQRGGGNQGGKGGAGGGGGGKSTGKQPSKRKLKKLNKKISKLERRIAALSTDDADEDSASSSEDEEAEQPRRKKQRNTSNGSNRNHPALNRRSGGG